MLDPEFVKILVCPDNRTPVRVASEQEITNLNQKIEDGTLQNIGRRKVNDKLDGGLIRAAVDRLYPVRKNIPVMLVEEAIQL
ncbi:MAG: Trm112 family protein [SAR324 cluster bacterium]|nr:Trm112 family protein [SAR324 cluster bacterium]